MERAWRMPSDGCFGKGCHYNDIPRQRSPSSLIGSQEERDGRM